MLAVSDDSRNECQGRNVRTPRNRSSTLCSPCSRLGQRAFLHRWMANYADQSFSGCQAQASVREGSQEWMLFFGARGASLASDSSECKLSGARPGCCGCGPFFERRLARVSTEMQRRTLIARRIVVELRPNAVCVDPGNNQRPQCLNRRRANCEL